MVTPSAGFRFGVSQVAAMMTKMMMMMMLMMMRMMMMMLMMMMMRMLMMMMMMMLIMTKMMMMLMMMRMIIVWGSEKIDGLLLARCLSQTKPRKKTDCLTLQDFANCFLYPNCELGYSFTSFFLSDGQRHQMLLILLEVTCTLRL